MYISTVSVYSDAIPPNGTESSELVALTPVQGQDTESIPIDKDTYGPLKLLCEQRVKELYLDPLIIRPTYVIGPFDYTMRFPKWIQRISNGGVVDCPSPASNHVQFIDARDQAVFVALLIEKNVSGCFHTPNPPIEFKEMLEAINLSVGSSNVTLNFLSEEETKNREAEFPMWSGQVSSGLMEMNSAAAVLAGLTFRPLSETIIDTFKWLQSLSQK